jgi:hypothetical protein
MKRASLLLAMLLSVSGAVLAHPDHDEAPPQTIRFTATQDAKGVTIAVSDRGAKVPTAGATGKLVWYNSTVKGEAPLLPAGVNRMEAKGAKVPADTRMQATITFGDKNVVTADVEVK